MKNGRYYRLLICVLVASIAAKFFLILTIKPSLWNDEMIVLTIGKQNLSELKNTILFEPHPPLFYIITKYLPSNIQYTRILLSLFGYSVLLFAIHTFQKARHIDMKVCNLGLILFICSTSFLTITSDIKQDSVSFPLLLLLISITSSQPYPKIYYLVLQHVLLGLILITGYQSYMWAILALISINVYFKNYKGIAHFLLLQTIITAIYYIVFMQGQLVNNLGRFEWTDAQSNNLLALLSSHVSGDITVVGVMYSLLLIGAAIYSGYRIWKQNKTLGFLYVLTLVIPVIIGTNIRIRYTAFQYLILCMSFAYTLIILKINKKIIYLLVLSLFVLGTSGYAINKQYLKTFKTNLYNALAEEVHDKKYIIGNGQNVFPHVFNIVYLKSSNLIAINPYTYMPFTSKHTLASEDLAANYSEDRLNNLKSLFNGKDILYLHTKHYSPNESTSKVKRELEQFCTLNVVKPINQHVDLYNYTRCSQ